VRHHIISDIGGEYDALMKLVKRLGEGKIYLVGDLNDRGPKSKQVIEWAMKDPRVEVCDSNHGDMFVDWYYANHRYDSDIFFYNGGLATLRSYIPDSETEFKRSFIPEDHITWLATLPAYIWIENQVLVTHAALPPRVSFEDAVDVKGENWQRTVLWSRSEPLETPYLQVFGHNSHWGLKRFDREDGTPYAFCLDDSAKGRLTALTWPEMKITQEVFRADFDKGVSP
jgi:hypothetical protein